MSDRCQKCGKVLSASADSATLCCDCRRKTETMNARAFPCVPHDLVGRVVGMEYGLTKREWFAGMMMAGYSANPAFTEVKAELLSKYAVEQADALMKELNK